MRGIKTFTLFWALAWFLAGGGALWRSCAGSSARDQANAEKIEAIKKKVAEKIAKLDDTKAAAAKQDQDKLEKLKTKLAADEDALSKAGTEAAAKLAKAIEDLATVRETGDSKKISKAQRQVERFEKQLASAKASPQKKRDATAETIEQAEMAAAKASEKIQGQIADLKKSQATDIAAVSGSDTGSGGDDLPWGPMGALVIACLLVGLGLILGQDSLSKPKGQAPPAKSAARTGDGPGHEPRRTYEFTPAEDDGGKQPKPEIGHAQPDASVGPDTAKHATVPDEPTSDAVRAAHDLAADAAGIDGNEATFMTEEYTQETQVNIKLVDIKKE